MSFGRGDFLVFLCAFAFTGHILCVDHYVQKVDGIALSCVQFAVMMVLSTVCAFTFETVDFAALGECTFTSSTSASSRARAATRQILAQKDGDPTVVSLLLSLESFFAVVCGAIVLHERMSGQGVPRLRADACGGHPLAAAGEDSRRSGAAEKIR